MPIEDDVVVVGGGLAGATAALAAARTGARVRIVTAAESSLRSASGLVDVLGYGADGTGPLADPFDAIDGLPASHPYAVLGAAAVRDGLALFDDAVPGYAGDHTDRNALVATAGGTVKPTARYPAAVAPGLASDDRPALLVGFETLPGLDAPLAAAHLDAAGVPFDVRGVTVRFPGGLRADAAATRYARALDRDRDVRDAVVEAVEAHLGDAGRVGFPAVLGLEAPAAVRTDLAEALGVDVFEVPGGPPSLPGIRLERALEVALADAGVRMAAGNPVIAVEADDGSVRAVVADRSGSRVPYSAASFVLATGGPVGGGIGADRERVREPVFGCHVPHPFDREDWYADDAFGAHPFARFGVRIDRGCRPLDADGEPEYDNLRAAGGVVGGADVAAEKSASGVSLATGRVAGTRAGEAA